MSMIIEVPVTYEALVVPPRSQNERRALLVATLPLRIPEADASLEVAARLKVNDRLERQQPTSRNGWVEYFTEGDGSRGLLERMPTPILDEDTYGYQSMTRADLPLSDAKQHMVGGAGGGLKALQSGQFWNPFGTVGVYRPSPYEVLAPEGSDMRSCRPSPTGPSREQAIETAHAAAASMRALPDGRILVPSIGPIWKVGHSNDDQGHKKHVESGSLRAVRVEAPIGYGKENYRDPVDWRWNVRGDRFADAVGMARAFGGTPTSDLSRCIEVLRPEAFLTDDRTPGWSKAAAAFTDKPPGSIRLEDLWGHRPGVPGMVPGDYKPAWSMDQVIAALQTRDAVLRDNPQDAAECATKFLEAIPELRGKGGFDVIEAQANRFLGRYEAAMTPKRGARLR